MAFETLAVINESLEPIILEASQCIDQDLLILDVDYEEDKRLWKTIMLIAIIFRLVIKCVGTIH